MPSKKKVPVPASVPAPLPAPVQAPVQAPVHTPLPSADDTASATEVISLEPHTDEVVIVPIVEPKKRAPPRKKTVAPVAEPVAELGVAQLSQVVSGSSTGSATGSATATAATAAVPAKKTRANKIITKQPAQTASAVQVSNVILHLKCSMSDLNEYNTKLHTVLTTPLEYDPSIPPEVASYQNPNTMYSQFADMPDLGQTHAGQTHAGQTHAGQTHAGQTHAGQTNPAMFPINNSACCPLCAKPEQDDLAESFDTTNDASLKDINARLKQLKIQLYKNSLHADKKSACFWCTYDYDNTPCYIPKYEMDGVIYGYGSFCRPECAVAYLMKENLDDSTKFERYHLLNQIYSKVYNCKKNIKPAPDPHYLLDKFYGNLSIQEYRKLLKTEHLLLVVDKPLTRVLPELHEDTDEMIMGIYGITKSTAAANGVYKVKRQSEKQSGPSKSSILRDTFGLA